MQRQLGELDSARKRFIADGVARAAHADLLARRLPRAAAGRGARPRDRDAFLTQVRDQVERLKNLATDLLDLSKLEAGSLELRRERPTCTSSRRS
jgi:signal transduction histidine kinase